MIYFANNLDPNEAGSGESVVDNTLDSNPGTGCSKLTTSLVNDSLNYQKLISQICQYVC